MKKFLDKFILVTSKILVRIMLLTIVILILPILLKFNNNMIVFAKAVETSKFEQKKMSIFNEFIKNNEVWDNINIENYIIDQENSKYITASMESAEDYPEDWLKDFNQKIILLQILFPKGSYWNHMGSNVTNMNNIYSVTYTPCNHSQNGEIYCNSHHGKSDEAYPYEATSIQCWGFASLLSDMVFGSDAPVRKFYDYDEIRIGDQARIGYDYHTVFIIDKTDEYVVVAECNEDLETCKINWGRKILKEDLWGWYMTRWED